MDERLNPLFTPWKIGNVEIKNRIVMTSMGGTDLFGWMEVNHFDKVGAKFLMEVAKNNVGLVLPGMQCVRDAMGGRWLYQNKKMFKDLAEWLPEFHKTGSKLFIQLAAGMGRSMAINELMVKMLQNKAFGAVSKPFIDIDYITASASATPNRWYPEIKSRPLTVDEIHEMVDAFAKTAKLLQDAGVDGVEIHAVHEGYLLDQFTIANMNYRTDEYGGSIENRAKFPLMVIDRVRQRCGENFLIEYRMSGSEEIEGGLTQEDGIAFAKMLDGKVDLIHVSAGLDIEEAQAVHTHPTMFLPHMPNVKYAAEVKKAVSKCPVVTVGSVVTPAEAEQVLEDGKADAVAMVRFQIELENRLASGETLTELTVDEILHKYRSANDKFLVESFGTIAAYGGNAAMMHYHATPEDHAVLQRKGFLLVDSGATYLDGTTDITRTYPLGPLTEDEKRFYTWTLQSHIDLAKAVWLDYCDCHMLDTIAREPLWRHLINYRCGTGHSVSFVGNVHEGPHALNGRNTTVFQPGMIITDEPGVYEAGQVGIRIENELECYHKADNQYGTFLAFRPLTFVPIATSPIVPGVLDKEQVAWLNDYHRKVFEQLAPRLTEDERAWLAEKCAAIGC